MTLLWLCPACKVGRNFLHYEWCGSCGNPKPPPPAEKKDDKKESNFKK